MALDYPEKSGVCEYFFFIRYNRQKKLFRPVGAARNTVGNVFLHPALP